jgi:hypothetical protein
MEGLNCMQILKQGIVFGTILLLCVGCTQHDAAFRYSSPYRVSSYRIPHQYSNHKTKLTRSGDSYVRNFNARVIQTFSLAHFDAIIADGAVNVEINNGPKSVKLVGLYGDIIKYEVVLQNSKLYISNDGKRRPNTVMKITVPNLVSLRATGSSNITSKNLVSDGLELIADSYGAMHIEGKMNIKAISQLGYGKIDVSWVSSPQLEVDCSAPGPVYIAGVTNSLVARVHNGANLDARYLRAKSATIAAIDSAHVAVTPLDFFSAYAVDKSVINYFKVPKKIVIFTKNHGEVLHSDWLH